MSKTDIYRTLTGLDPKDDSHWNNDGSPSVDKVNELMPKGADTVAKRDIAKVMPGYDRELAAEVKVNEVVAQEVVSQEAVGDVLDQLDEVVNKLRGSSYIKVGTIRSICDLWSNDRENSLVHAGRIEKRLGRLQEKRDRQAAREEKKTEVAA